MSDAFPFLAALANAAVLGFIALLLRGLGRAGDAASGADEADIVVAIDEETEVQAASEPVEPEWITLADIRDEEAASEDEDAVEDEEVDAVASAAATHRLAAFQKTMQAPIVLRLEDVVVPKALEAPSSPVAIPAPARAHHHH